MRYLRKQGGWLILASLLAVLIPIGLELVGDDSPYPRKTSHGQADAIDASRVASSEIDGEEDKEVLRWQLHHFPILRTPPEPLPATLRDRLQPSSYGTSWDLAQRLPNRDRGNFWLIPGKRALCLLADLPSALGQSCAPRRIAIAHGVAIVVIAPRPKRNAASPSRYILGVAPAGSDTACIQNTRSTTAVPVVAHVFSLRDRDENPPKIVTYSQTASCL